MDGRTGQIMTKNTRTLMYGEPYKVVVLFKTLYWPYNVAKTCQNGGFYYEYIDIGLIQFNQYQ